MEPRAKDATRLEIPPGPSRHRAHWRRAWRALRELIADPEDTAKASDIFLAIGRGDLERWFQKFCADARGRALLAERPSLPDVLGDRERLERMPEGSLGRAYLDYLDRNGFEATALVELQARVYARWQREEGIPDVDPFRCWFMDRQLITHDLLHVLTDYGTDGVGEATLLAYELPWKRGWANSLLTFGAAAEMCRHGGTRWLRYVFRAWRRGRRATWLVLLPLEQLLPLRLETVRSLAGVASVAESHPGGILSGRLNADGSGSMAWS